MVNYAHYILTGLLRAYCRACTGVSGKEFLSPICFCVSVSFHFKRLKSLALVTKSASAPLSLGLRPEGGKQSPCQGCELPSFPGLLGQRAVAACRTNRWAFYSKSKRPSEIGYKILHVHPAERISRLLKMFKCYENVYFHWQSIQ